MDLVVYNATFYRREILVTANDCHCRPRCRGDTWLARCPDPGPDHVPMASVEAALCFDSPRHARRRRLAAITLDNGTFGNLRIFLPSIFAWRGRGEVGKYDERIALAGCEHWTTFLARQRLVSLCSDAMQLVTRPGDAESVNHSLAILPHCLIMLIQRYGSPDITLQVTSYIICCVNKMKLILYL